MLDFCPLCEKNGHKNKIILSQINLEEAVWLCKAADCPWPFGYENFTFVPRKVGETWSSEWEIHKPSIQKSAEPSSVFLNELGLDTPPVTPGSGNEVVLKESVLADGTNIGTSSSLSANDGIKTKGQFRLKNSTNKLRCSHTSECGSMDSESAGTRLSDKAETSSQNKNSHAQSPKGQDPLNNSFITPESNESRVQFDGDFDLSDDVTLEDLAMCLSPSEEFTGSCNTTETVTKSIFNVQKPLQNSLPVFETSDDLCDNANHESTVKCKKWLSDNTNIIDMVRADHCYTVSAARKKGKVRSGIVSPQMFDSGVYSTSKTAPVNSNKKQLPKIKSIEKMNVKLVSTLVVSNRKNSCAPVPHTEVKLLQNNKSVLLTPKTVKIAHCNSVAIDSGYKSEPQDSNLQQNTSGTYKIDNITMPTSRLSPISLSNKMPNYLEDSANNLSNMASQCTPTDETMKMDVGIQPVVKNSVTSSNLKTETIDCQEIKNCQPTGRIKAEVEKQSHKKSLKRIIPKINKYQGFNFGTLKKKCEGNAGHGDANIKTSLSSIPSPDNVSSCSDATYTSETSCTTTTTVDSKSESVYSNTISNSKSTLAAESYNLTTLPSDLKGSNMCSPRNDEALDTNFNLDLVLDDFMLNNSVDSVDLPQVIGDDWLVSLFD